MTLTVWSRDANRIRRGLLPVISASAVLRESGVHTWVLALDGNDEESRMAQRGTGVGEELLARPCRHFLPAFLLQRKSPLAI